MADKPVIGAPTLDDATITASEEYSGFVADNLLLNGVGRRWESSDTSGIKTIKLDAGELRSVSLFGLLHSNGSATGGWRVRAADTEAELTTNPSIDNNALGGSAIYTTADEGSTSDVSWTSADFTMEMWVKVNQSGRNPLVQRDLAGTSPSLIVNSSGKFELADLPDRDHSVVGTTDVEVGTWYHVAGTYSNSSGQAKLYVNGALENSATGVSWGTGTVFTFNYLFNNRGAWEMQEPRIWDDVRTAAQIANNYDEPLDGTEAGLLGAWDFLTVTGSDYTNNVAGGPVLAPGGAVRTYPLKMWGTDDLEAYTWKDAVLHVKLGVYARWFQIDILDEANTEARLRVSRLIVSEALQTEKWQIAGSTIVGKRDTSSVQTSALGYESVVQRDVRGDARIRFESKELYEVNWIDDIYQRQGSVRDVLYVRDPTATNRIEKGIMLGRLDPSLRITHDGWSLYRGSFRIRGI